MTTLTNAWRAIRSAVLADSDIVEKLGSADAFYRRLPRETVPLPCIVMALRTIRPREHATQLGLYTVDLQFNLYAIDCDDLDSLVDLLEFRFSIPVRRPQGIDATSHRVTSLRFLNAIEVGPVRFVSSNQDVHQMTVEAVARVIRKTVPDSP